LQCRGPPQAGPYHHVMKSNTKRFDGRKPDELRKATIKPNVNRYAEGSCLIKMGHTQVLCLASVEEELPRWRKDSGLGWVTAEYAMLPRATHTRSRRESVKGKVSGRTQEISRLIGRALRAVVDFEKLGPRSISVDCEVLQADGGTRCASITGAYVALVLACKYLKKQKLISAWPLLDSVSAISVGILHGQNLLDLPYEEDSAAEVDMNIVMTGKGKLVEIQGTAEQAPFSFQKAGQLMKLAGKGCEELRKLQNEVVKL